MCIHIPQQEKGNIGIYSPAIRQFRARIWILHQTGLRLEKVVALRTSEISLAKELSNATTHSRRVREGVERHRKRGIWASNPGKDTAIPVLNHRPTSMILKMLFFIYKACVLKAWHWTYTCKIETPIRNITCNIYLQGSNSYKKHHMSMPPLTSKMPLVHHFNA